MTDPFEWINLFPQSTGLPVTIYVGFHGGVATDPRHPGKLDHAALVSSWTALNREALDSYWRETTDGVQLAQALKPLGVKP